MYNTHHDFQSNFMVKKCVLYSKFYGNCLSKAEEFGDICLEHQLTTQAAEFCACWRQV